MAKRSKPVVKVDKVNKYIELVCAFPLRPIRTAAALDRAIAMIDVSPSIFFREELQMTPE